MSHVLGIDQGTTGTTVLLVKRAGDVAGRGYREVTQHYPKPAWVEHDAEEIWQSVRDGTRQARAAAGASARETAAVGSPVARTTGPDAATSRPAVVVPVVPVVPGVVPFIARLPRSARSGSRSPAGASRR